MGSDVFRHAVHVALEHLLRKHPRGEVAVGTLRFAEGYGDVNTERQGLIIVQKQSFSLTVRQSVREPIIVGRVCNDLVKRAALANGTSQ
jgi:hypothetical protein